MAMKRRSFLTMLGAVAAAPFVPATAVPAAGYSRASFGLAVAHAQKYPLLSVGGMAKQIGVTPVEARAIITEMSRDGMVKLLGPASRGRVLAASNILTNDPWGFARTSQPRRESAASKEQGHRTERAGRDKPFDPMLAYLHDLCRSRGMTLHPRCFTVGGLA